MTIKRNENNEVIYFNPVRTPQDTIDCTVILEETGEEIPFTATPYDVTQHGQDLWAQLSASSEVLPCPEERRYLTADVEARSKRGELLAGSDWTQLPDILQATKDLWAPYRQALRDITEQEGYPYQIDWPIAPGSGIQSCQQHRHPSPASTG